MIACVSSSLHNIVVFRESANYVVRLFDRDKIAAAGIENDPYPHIQINTFLNESHFSQIVSTREIAIPSVSSDEQLFDTLIQSGWKVITFPGCITDVKTYIDWHSSKETNQRHNNSACEGFGVTLRLIAPQSPILVELAAFMASEPFQKILAAKFSIRWEDVYYDGGIQKYLDGYEISPHPDIRRKAITYMVNINPHRESEKEDHHTHYLTFKDEYKYVQAYWEGRPSEERCWVPWDWCESKKIQRENNSIVIFSPSSRTMHGVKARYNHLNGQRTQLYGNLWYHANPALIKPEWEDFVIQPGRNAKSRHEPKTLLGRIKSSIPESAKAFIKNTLLGHSGVDDKPFVAIRTTDGR